MVSLPHSLNTNVRSLPREPGLAWLQQGHVVAGGRPWSLTPTQILGLAEAMKDPATKPGELARELGITVPTIYRYVTKKGELTEDGRRTLAAGKKYGRARSEGKPE